MDIFEEWKPIEGHENYLISTIGRCISKPRITVQKNGKKRFFKGKIKTPHDNGTGYFAYQIDGKTEYIHRLVAQTFLPNTENKKEVDHIDGNKSNNNIENLRWVTRSENLRNPVTYPRMSEVQIKRTIVMLDADGKYICEAKGVPVMSKICGFPEGGIKNCLSSRMNAVTCNGFRFLYKEDYNETTDYRVCLSHNMGHDFVINDRIVVVYSENNIDNVFPSTIEAERNYGIPRKYIFDMCYKHIDICKKHALRLPSDCKMYFYKDLSKEEQLKVFDIYRHKYPIPNIL